MHNKTLSIVVLEISDRWKNWQCWATGTHVCVDRLVDDDNNVR